MKIVVRPVVELNEKENNALNIAKDILNEFINAMNENFVKKTQIDGNTFTIEQISECWDLLDSLQNEGSE